MPSIWMVSITLSRVVPAIGVTMATSEPARAFKQRGLADVGLADQHHVQAVAQQGALRRLREHVLQRGADAGQLAARIGFFQEVDFLFRKIERGFHQHAQVDHLFDQFVDGFRERAGQRVRGRARRRFGRGLDQVGHRFRLRQVELVVEEGAPREFARFGQPQADFGAGFEAARQQHLQHHRAAVAVQFQHVFAGIGMRRLEIQRQPLVDHFAVGVGERQVGGVARLQDGAAAEQGLDHRGQVLAGQAHHADAAASGCSGDRGDGGRVEVHA